MDRLNVELLRTGNIRVMHSIRYRLREQTLEEDEILKHAVEDEQLPRGAEKRSALNAAYQGEQNGSTNSRT